MLRAVAAIASAAMVSKYIAVRCEPSSPLFSVKQPLQ